MLLIPGDRPDLTERLDAHLPVPAGIRDSVAGRWTSSVVVFKEDWTPAVQPVGPFPGEKNRYGSIGLYVARAMQEALRSIGARRRGMGLRTNSHMLAVYGKVLLLAPVLFLVVHFLRLVLP